MRHITLNSILARHANIYQRQMRDYVIYEFIRKVYYAK